MKRMLFALMLIVSTSSAFCQNMDLERYFHSIFIYRNVMLEKDIDRMLAMDVWNFDQYLHLLILKREILVIQKKTPEAITLTYRIMDLIRLNDSNNIRQR